MTESLAHLFFALTPSIGPLHFSLLVDYFGSAKKAYQASQQEFVKIGLSPRKAALIARFRSNFKHHTSGVCRPAKIGSHTSDVCFPVKTSNHTSDVWREVERLENAGCWFVARCDSDYPKLLRQLKDAPIVLFGKGDKKKFVEFTRKPTIAVVGSRKITGYGRRVTARLVSDLVAYGFTIVSGMMYGVDEAGHRAALTAQGNTIGVWAGGIDTLYTCSRAHLAREMEKRGIILSEFPLGFTPSKGTFPARNRIVSGLSLGAVVIEGATDSGSLITARLSTEQGREVFAVPGPITSIQSQGPAQLIKSGAKLVSSVQDILDELPSVKSRAKPGSKASFYQPTNKTEAMILEFLQNEPANIDDLVRKTNLPSKQVLATLSLLELKGVIEKGDNAISLS